MVYYITVKKITVIITIIIVIINIIIIIFIIIIIKTLLNYILSKIDNANSCPEKVCTLFGYFSLGYQESVGQSCNVRSLAQCF